MSGQRNKNTSSKGSDEAQARLVVMPKEQPAPAPKAAAERIGDRLRQARLAKNDDLYQIAEYLCIKPNFLIALENSRYDELPADAYVIGFLRTYANFLEIDGKEAVDRYRYEMAGRRRKPVLSMPTPVTEGRAPSGIIMVGATVGLLLIYALWYGISSANRAEVHQQPPLPTVAQPSPAATDTNAAAGLTAPVTTPAPATATPAPQPPMPVSVIPPAAPGIVLTGELPAASDKPIKDTTVKDGAKEPDAKKDTKAKDESDSAEGKKQSFGEAGSSRITVRALQSSWVMVTDDSGKAVFDHVLRPGETYKVPNKPGLTLTTGNGSGIVLSLDGNDLPKIANGAPHVVRNIKLDPDHLNVEPSGATSSDH